MLLYMVQYNRISHTALQLLRHNANWNLCSTKTPHISPSRVSYGVFVLRTVVKTDYILMAPHCKNKFVDGGGQAKCVSDAVLCFLINSFFVQLWY